MFTKKFIKTVLLAILITATIHTTVLLLNYSIHNYNECDNLTLLGLLIKEKFKYLTLLILVPTAFIVAEIIENQLKRIILPERVVLFIEKNKSFIKYLQIIGQVCIGLIILMFLLSAYFVIKFDFCNV